jgi:hypothetical protein
MAIRRNNRKVKKAKITNSGKVKVKKKNILALILVEGKGCEFIWLNQDQERFSYNGNTYFKQDQGTYIYGKKRIRVAVYLEGISVPMHHAYIEREKVTRTIMNRDTGKEEKVSVNQIKGLKFDSAVIDMLLNRHLADEFTKQHMDIPNLILIVLMIVILILGVINVILGVI